MKQWIQKKLKKIVHNDGKENMLPSTTMEKKPCYRISSSSRVHTVIFQVPCDRLTYTPMPQQYCDVSCYIHGDGTFYLKIDAVVVWGGGNLYNLDEMECQMIFYKTMKKIFFQLFST